MSIIHGKPETRNPNFEIIKESIRRRGLDHKPNITQRPGEPYYIIADGGNTRIQALKELFTETQDQRFWSIECLYKPWKGDSADSVEAELDLLIGLPHAGNQCFRIKHFGNGLAPSKEI